MHFAGNVRCVNATDSGVKPATVATAPSSNVPFNFTVFDTKCAELGAVDESSRAKLLGVSRVTIWRWRKGDQQPSLLVTSHVARTLGVSVDELTGRAA